MSEQTKKETERRYKDPWEENHGFPSKSKEVREYQETWRAGYTWPLHHSIEDKWPEAGNYSSYEYARSSYLLDKRDAQLKLDLGLRGEMYANDQGGKQTKLPHRLDLLPMTSLLAIGRVLAHGSEKYGEDNWHQTTVRENINHALGHVAAFLLGDKSEPHLSHFATRALMALFLEIRDRETLGV